MKDYYNLFVELSIKQCTKEDYANNLKVKAHNAAAKKLKQLQSKMEQSNCQEVLRMLLSHEDDRVKINAASLCLRKNVLIDQTVCVLKKIIDQSCDPTICFSAEMMLLNVSKQKTEDSSLS